MPDEETNRNIVRKAPDASAPTPHDRPPDMPLAQETPDENRAKFQEPAPAKGSAGSDWGIKSPRYSPAVGCGLMFYFMVFLAGIALLIWHNDHANEFIKERWWLAAAIVILPALLFLFPKTRSWFALANTRERIRLIIFLVIPAILLLIGLITFLDDDYQVPLLRVIFLIVVCLLPAVMYYLFIATKKYSLYNEYINNLDRLGLLDPIAAPPELVAAGIAGETREEQQRRVFTYRQKFEAVYGPVPTNLGGIALDAMNPGSPPPSAANMQINTQEASGFTGSFSAETTLPVILATVLIALGWLTTLPPQSVIPAAKSGPAAATAATQASGESPAATQVKAPVSGGQNQATAAAAAGEAATASSGETAQASPPNQTDANPAQNNQDAATNQPGTAQPAGAADAAAAPASSPNTTATQTDGAQPTAPSLAGEPGQVFSTWLQAFKPERGPESFAFIGAYFFSLQLLFRRYVRRDLRASAYVAVSLRIVLSYIGIWVLTEAVLFFQAADPTQQASMAPLMVLGFVIGVFPRVLWQYIQMVTKRYSLATVVMPSLQPALPLSDLDGLTVWHEARLEEEDIENIPNMATADLIDLMLNTRLPTDRIIDWMDQAILYTHLGPTEQGMPNRRALLRAHGIRTASALIEAYKRSEQHNDRADFERILPGDGRSVIRSLVDAMEISSNLKLIQTWRGLQSPTHLPDATEQSSPATASEVSAEDNGHRLTGESAAPRAAASDSADGSDQEDGDDSAAVNPIDEPQAVGEPQPAGNRRQPEGVGKE